MRESEIERHDRERVEADGGLLLKFVSPCMNGVPDRIKLTEIAPEDRETVAKYFRFAEYKKPGEKPRPSQVRVHARLRAMGFVVDVIDRKTP